MTHTHTHTHTHTYTNSVGLLWKGISPSRRPVPCNTQHAQQTDINAPGGIRTRNPSKRAVADPRIRPHASTGTGPDRTGPYKLICYTEPTRKRADCQAVLHDVTAVCISHQMPFLFGFNFLFPNDLFLVK